MKTLLTFPFDVEVDLPPRFLDTDVLAPASCVAHFVEEFSDPGDRVFDPFAGFGTTLAVAERLDRVPYGLEYERERVEFIRSRIDAPENVRHGDALDLSSFDFPTFDLALTSPPFTTEQSDHDPFQNYAGESTYDEYLANVGRVFAQLAAVMAEGGVVLVDASNMKHDGEVTTLAWDVADVVRETFHFETEVVVGWENDHSAYGYDHTYWLVFENRA